MATAAWTADALLAEGDGDVGTPDREIDGLSRADDGGEPAAQPVAVKVVATTTAAMRPFTSRIEVIESPPRE
ncbi:hypothetical protein Raf01_42650 [Rugosimonospora africana]|uniref:Uncharacterized protein n=1 Tax=Rugosimonospora africana TaxID=556532 RepID=A0A8J3VS53_9ACTN|nr:hypothetical protein Raf01_42650 [Rugosimonospora africana]